MSEENMIIQNIENANIGSIIPQRFLNYAMYVAQDRALPDIKDGLKPVHRRILYAMRDLGLAYNKPYKKSARTVGDVLGRFHPHGDTSVYEAMVILAQDFSTRYPLVDMEGNVGSVDGDPAAAMRYTLARLRRIGQAMMNDINKNSIDYKPNYDGEEQEPTVLSTLLPMTLLNGSFGIAVGLTTRIPSHNIRDIYNACYHIIDNTIEGKETDIEDVINIIKAPDFATGGTIIGLSGVKEGYRTGKGKVVIRSKYEIVDDKKGCNIIITEIPYKVNKASFIESVRDLMKDEKNTKGQLIKASTFPQIKEIRDESDKEGLRVVIELKKDENPQIVINNLIKYTKFQDSFNMNLTALENNKPKVFNILEILESFLAHAAEVIVRRSQFDLDKASTRLNIVDGVLMCTSSEELLSQVISAIRFAEDDVTALMELGFNKAQAEYIADMKIRALSNISKDKLLNEKSELEANIEKLNAIINDDSALLTAIKTEFMELEDKFGDDRRTEISIEEGSIEEEDLIKEETLIVTYTTEGTIKAVEEGEYKAQRRGGKGVKATNTKEDEIIKFMFTTSSKDDLLFFTTEGRCHVLKAYKIGKSSKAAKGRNISNYLNLNVGEKIISVLNTNIKNKDSYLFFITKYGVIKKLSLSELSTRYAVTRVISFKENDYLVQALLVNDSDSVLMVTGKGKSIRINTDIVRAMGRSAAGVIGISVAEDDKVVDMCIVTDDDLVLTITDKGLSKKTKASEWAIKGRGGKGMVAHDITSKTGEIVAVMTADETDELFIATEQGLITRISTKDIRTCGRSSKGVKAINLNNDDNVASVSINKGKDLEESEE